LLPQISRPLDPAFIVFAAQPFSIHKAVALKNMTTLNKMETEDFMP